MVFLQPLHIYSLSSKDDIAQGGVVGPQSAGRRLLVQADQGRRAGAARKQGRRGLGGSGGILQDFSPAGWENCWVLPPMRKIPKPSPPASPLLFELDPEPLEETLTALGGIPLVVQAFRSLELPRSIQEQVRVKQRERG